jgi:hypothetical protein
MVIDWRRLSAVRTNRLAVGSREHRNLNGLADKPHLIVHKGLEFMAPIQDSLQLHLLSPFLV